MNKKTFIDHVIKYLRRPCGEDVKQNLVKVPGRQPAKEDVELSDWFSRLDKDDQAMVNKIIDQSVDEAIFGMLCVLDGVRNILDNEEGTRLDLYYINSGNRVLLNGMEDGEFLHDLYQAHKSNE